MALCCLPARAAADPICCGGERGPTLVGDFNQASLVLLGTFTNPQGVVGNGTTDFAITKVFKGAEILGTRKVLEKYGRVWFNDEAYLIIRRPARAQGAAGDQSTHTPSETFVGSSESSS